jgi:hypothetical protein
MMAIRFSEEDRALLAALVRHKAEQLAGEGVEVSAASVLRGLIRQAAADLGLTPTDRKSTPKRRGS